jgi:serine/threonine protein kinase
VEATILLRQSEAKHEFSEFKNDHRDCLDILNSYDISYVEAEEYFQVGSIPQKKGWLLYISVIWLEFLDLLQTVLPILTSSQVAFKIPRDLATVRKIQDGNFGVTNLDKLVCIYVDHDGQLPALAKTLVDATLSFKSPSIPGHRSLGGCVYTIYDSFTPLVVNNSNNIFSVQPKSVQWPFEELVPYKIPERKALWNYRYKPLFVIKPDTKGRVIQANYFKSLFNIKLCIIKEGIKNRWVDDHGRDIVSRVKWQYELYTDLSGYIPTPEIFDIFEENGNTYLAMEFIKGPSLNQRINSIYNGNSWFQLSRSNKLLLVGYLLKLVSLTKKLHEKGYIHRDITPANFIIDRKNNIYLIDMELAYSIFKEKPTPPFKLGTEGYMSPEQQDRQPPTVKEDVYALGALMLFAFTGIQPMKANPRTEELSGFLQYTMDEPALIHLIQECLSLKPEDRPTLTHISESLDHWQIKSKTTTSIKKHYHNVEAPNSEEVKNMIQKAIGVFTISKSISSEGLWLSPREEIETIGLPSELGVSPGFSTGIAGILFLLYRAHRLGYNIASCLPICQTNWQYIERGSIANNTEIASGLFFGSAGLGLAYVEGVQSGLLLEKEDVLRNWFATDRCHGHNLAAGIAGQGLSILRCYRSLDPGFASIRLQSIVNNVLLAQQKDGSWNNFRNTKRKSDNIIGLAKGTAGIICFLIAYARNNQNQQVITSIQRGLEWLIKKAQKAKGRYIWNLSTRSTSIDEISCAKGIPGIALTFIRAYQFLNDPKYKLIAENALYRLPNQPVTVDFTQMHGLSGLGEVYLEAAHILGSADWQERANWIAGIFHHTMLGSEKTPGYWAMNVYTDLESNLMKGCSGIIHFLLRSQATPFVADHPLIGTSENILL